MKAYCQILAIVYIISILNAIPGEGIHDTLMALSRAELENWALATEKYHREKNNQKNIFGGLHDYIKTLSLEEIRKHITKEVEEHPEIDNVDVIKGLTKKYGFGKESKESKDNIDGGDGGLLSMLATAEKEELVKYALALERYHKRHQPMMLGGLHDYINNMSRDELQNYIHKELDEHDEINHLQKLQALTNKKFLKKRLKFLERIGERKFKRIGGLHDFIFRLPREKLEAYALAIEKWERDVKKKHMKGGIHDYIKKLKDEEIVKYILKKIRFYPELNSKEVLDKISSSISK